MTPNEFRDLIRPTLDDRRLSRAERQSLAAVLNEVTLQDADFEAFRCEAFELARQALSPGPDREIIAWLEDLVRQLKPATSRRAQVVDNEAYFSPGEACRRKICSLCRQARISIDICVFTITDDEIADAILDAHRRRVAIRLITDNEKAFDLGSDVMRLQENGVPVRIDLSEHHMHHKYAIFDRTVLLTGSYNWTRSAAEHNEENIIVTGDPDLLRRFQPTFDEFWSQLET